MVPTLFVSKNPEANKTSANNPFLDLLFAPTKNSVPFFQFGGESAEILVESRVPSLASLSAKVVADDFQKCLRNIPPESLSLDAKEKIFNQLAQMKNLKDIHVEMLLPDDIMHLNLRKYRQLTDASLDIIAKRCSRLQSLDIRNTSFTSEALLRFCQETRCQLQVLNVSSKDPSVLMYILDNTPTLRVLGCEKSIHWALAQKHPQVDYFWSNTTTMRDIVDTHH